MRKKISYRFCSLLIILFGLLPLCACFNSNVVKNITYEGKYYEVDINNNLMKDSWIQLSIDYQWEMSNDLEGTYEVKNGTITFISILGERNEGTINQDLIVLDGATYKKSTSVMDDETTPIAQIDSCLNGLIVNVN